MVIFHSYVTVYQRVWCCAYAYSTCGETGSQVTWPRHVQHQQRSRGPQAWQVAYVVRQVGPSILSAAMRRCHCGMESNNNEESSWSGAVIYIYIYPSIYIYTYYIHISIYVNIVSYVYIFIYAQVHVLSMYNVCSVYIYMYTIKLYNIHRFWISALYIQYNIHNTQCTVQNTQDAIRNMHQYAMCKTRHHINYVHPDAIAMILGIKCSDISGWYSHGRLGPLVSKLFNPFLIQHVPTLRAWQILRLRWKLVPHILVLASPWLQLGPLPPGDVANLAALWQPNSVSEGIAYSIHLISSEDYGAKIWPQSPFNANPSKIAWCWRTHCSVNTSGLPMIHGLTVDKTHGKLWHHTLH